MNNLKKIFADTKLAETPTIVSLASAGIRAPLPNGSLDFKRGVPSKARVRWLKAFQQVKHNNHVSKMMISHSADHIRKTLDADYIIANFDRFEEVISSVFENCKENTEGKVADYIPELSEYSPDNWGVSVCTIDGKRFSIGNVSTPFPIQSCCKPLNYALSLTEKLPSDVHRYVGMEPSGRLFNDLAFDNNKKPHNPMINAGAIMVSAMVQSKIKDPEERLKKVMSEYSRLAGGEFIGFNEKCFQSEKATAFRNFALAYVMRENGLCSIEITAESGAVIAGTLANGGFCPTTQEKVLKVGSVRDTLSLMFSCGMYDYSGQFAFKVGLPAKSGVSGVVLLVIPNVMGICMWSPPLDECGNSVRGLQFCQEFVNKFSFHHFDSLLHNSIKEDPCLRSTYKSSKKILALMVCAAEGDLTTMQRLGTSDVDMEMTDYSQRTALHVAAGEGHLDVVIYLLETCNVQHNPKDRWGHTPRDEAAHSKHDEVVTFFDNYQKMEKTRL